MEKNLAAEQEAKEKVKKDFSLLPNNLSIKQLVRVLSFLDDIFVRQMYKSYEKHLAHFYFPSDWLDWLQLPLN